MRATPHRSWHIGILGAGAAGLTVARALAHAGFPLVTVLEPSDHVGGKCRTFFRDGHSFELGAGVLTPAYVRVRALLREHGVRTAHGSVASYVHMRDRSITRVPDHTGSWARVTADTARLAGWLVRHPSIRSPGFRHVDDDLCDPFATWAARHQMAGAAPLVAPWFTAFGYGYLDEIPAAYVLKYASLFGVPMLEIIDEGYQGLWEHVARSIDVRLGVRVRRIERGDEILVHTGDDGGDSRRETWRFDALVVACPIEAVAPILGLDAAERALFANVRYNDYHVIGARVSGLPMARYAFMGEHLVRERAGHAMFWYRRWLDDDLVLFYALPRPGDSLDTTTACVEEDVARLRGSIARIELTKHWRYFPHVSPDAMRAGFFDSLDALQGEKRTYYAGELLSFAAVEPVVAHAEDLVHRHFTLPEVRPTRGKSAADARATHA